MIMVICQTINDSLISSWCFSSGCFLYILFPGPIYHTSSIPGSPLTQSSAQKPAGTCPRKADGREWCFISIRQNPLPSPVIHLRSLPVHANCISVPGSKPESTFNYFDWFYPSKNERNRFLLYGSQGKPFPVRKGLCPFVFLRPSKDTN